MAQRLELQTLLETLLGSRNVYFQPPASISMQYPAIRYALNDIENLHADNRVYSQRKSYSVTLIDWNPDNVYVDKLSALPMCSFDRHYVADNLNHYVFTLYF